MIARNVLRAQIQLDHQGQEDENPGVHFFHFFASMKGDPFASTQLTETLCQIQAYLNQNRLVFNHLKYDEYVEGAFPTQMIPTELAQVGDDQNVEEETNEEEEAFEQEEELEVIHEWMLDVQQLEQVGQEAVSAAVLLENDTNHSSVPIEVASARRSNRNRKRNK